MEHLAAIDIGSNAMRLAIARVDQSSYQVTYRTREAVRLGSDVFGGGVIQPKTYQELCVALQKFVNQLRNHRVNQCRAVATSALREAKNGLEVIQKLQQDTGMVIDLISGDEEARLVTLAIGSKLNLAQGRFLAIDIGGGSIELVAINHGQVEKKQSFVVGMVRLLELAKTHRVPMQEWLPPYLQDTFASFFSDLAPLPEAVGTGGSMDRFVKLKSFVSAEPGEFLRAGEMHDLQEKLLAVPYKERILKFCLKPDRADVIVPAAIATSTIMALGKSERIHFPQVGLKDGVLLELYHHLPSKGPS